MGLRAFLVRNIDVYRKMAFTRDAEGRLLYVPGGADNPFARRIFLVPDDETARRIEALERPWFNIGVTLQGLLLVVIGFVAARSSQVSLLLMISLLIIGFVPYVVLPFVLGNRIARALDLQLLPRKRTVGELAEGVTQLLGAQRSLTTILIVCAVMGVLLVAFVLSLAERGEPELAVFFSVLLGPILPFIPLHVMGLRARHARDANERLEGVVRERTVQLREVNAQLQARVAEQIAHMDRLGQLRHFFAAPVAEMILRKEGFDPSRVHRKELSVVSIDLQGFTAFSETAEPEEVIGVLRAYHTKLGEIVNKYQATLEHFAGESAMVFLNDPLDAPEHPRRAIAMAVELRAAIAPLVEDWRRLGYDLGWGAGIASGYATIGTVGYEGRWEYAAIGSVCNLAARLCAQAKDGQIVTTHRVLSRAGEGVGLEPLGDLVMKGISRPMAGFNVQSLA